MVLPLYDVIKSAVVGVSNGLREGCEDIDRARRSVEDRRYRRSKLKIERGEI